MHKKIVKLGKGWKEKKMKEIWGEEISWLGMLIPKEHVESFDIENIVKKKKEIIVKLNEKKEKIPESTKGKHVALNGYDSSVEVLVGHMNGRGIFVRYRCRKWLGQENKETHRNQYEFHPKGLKASHEFANFLKGKDREKSLHLLTSRRDVWDSRKENLSMV